VNATVAVPRAPRRERLIAVMAVLVAAGIGLIAFGPVPSTDSAPETAKVEAPGFTMSYPDGWQQVERAPAGMAAVVRREDGKAFLTIREEKPLAGDPDKLVGGLDRALDRRFGDFRTGSAQVVEIEAGRAIS
jgi:hypothetical protein